MHEYGLEMLLEIAHFWQSIAQFDPQHQRYSIEDVMGPDEFHEKYPFAQKGGLKNNAYTNMMVVWLFETIETLTNTFDAKVIDEQLIKTSAPKNFLQKMREIKHQLYLEINEDGIIAQFEGYFKLKELDWTAYQAKYSNIYRMDRLLNAETLSADDYQVAKQADTLMIFYNLSKKQVDHILVDLNYTLPEDYVEQNLAYYLARTTHGSTLSRIVHAQLAAIVKDDTLAWRLFQEALSSDYHDIQGGNHSRRNSRRRNGWYFMDSLKHLCGFRFASRNRYVPSSLTRALGNVTFQLYLAKDGLSCLSDEQLPRDYQQS